MRGSRPVAVFDSGVGGLTVLKAIRARLPREDLVYFGDTAHLPYGTKSPRTVRALTMTHLEFLAARGIKCAVIACNTASAVALNMLKRRLRVPVVGVIEPGIRAALARTRSGRVGVLGTATTISSGQYQLRLRQLAPGIRVTAQACPLFVPIIEEGWARHAIADTVAREYVAPLLRARVDTVILGCTHYPLLKPVLRRVLGKKVALVDSAEEVKVETERLLLERGLARPARGRRAGRTMFFLTDTGGSFKRIASRFLGSPPRDLVEVRLKVSARDRVRGGAA